MTEKKVWTDNRRNGFNWIVGEPEIGDDTWIGPFVVLDATERLEIGTRCSISAGAQIYTHQMAEPGRGGEKRTAPTEVGDDCYIGANAVVLEGCVINDGVTVGANSVVPAGTEIPEGEIWCGTPVKPV